MRPEGKLCIVQGNTLGVFMEIQKLKIYGNLWLIDGHFRLPPQARSANKYCFTKLLDFTD